MRIKDYIEATYAVTSSGTSSEIAINNLKLLLERKGLLKLYPRVLKGLLEKFQRKNTSLSAHVYIARDKDLIRHKDQIKSALEKINVLGEYATHIDPTLIGGFVASSNGKRVDKSHKSTLLHAYHKVVE